MKYFKKNVLMKAHVQHTNLCCLWFKFQELPDGGLGHVARELVYLVLHHPAEQLV
jgi:hypothetical protein